MKSNDNISPMERSNSVGNLQESMADIDEIRNRKIKRFWKLCTIICVILFLIFLILALVGYLFNFYYEQEVVKLNKKAPPKLQVYDYESEEKEEEVIEQKRKLQFAEAIKTTQTTTMKTKTTTKKKKTTKKTTKKQDSTSPVTSESSTAMNNVTISSNDTNNSSDTTTMKPYNTTNLPQNTTKIPLAKCKASFFLISRYVKNKVYS